MKTVLLVSAIASMICTVGFTIMMLVLCIAGCANSTPEQLRTIKLTAGGFSLLAFLGIVGGAWLLYTGKPGLAIAVALFPTVAMMVTFVIKTL